MMKPDEQIMKSIARFFLTQNATKKMSSMHYSEVNNSHPDNFPPYKPILGGGTF